MASEITSVGDELIQFLSSFPPLNLRQDLEDNLFDNNSEYEDYECNINICNSDHFNHRSDRAYDKSSYDEMLKMLLQEKKNLRGKGRRVNNNNK